MHGNGTEFEYLLESSIHELDFPFGELRSLGQLGQVFGPIPRHVYTIIIRVVFCKTQEAIMSKGNSAFSHKASFFCSLDVGFQRRY